MPNWGQEPDKTFDIRLTDAVAQHEIYLTRLVFEPVAHEPTSPESGTRDSQQSRRRAGGGGGTTAAAGLVSAVLLVAGALVAVVLLSLAAAHVCRAAATSAEPPAAAVVVSEKDSVVYDVRRAQVVTATAGA